MSSLKEISDLRGRSDQAIALEGAWMRLTLFSLAPMYLLRISGPLTEMKLSPHSLATAEASRVFPQPGKP